MKKGQGSVAIVGIVVIVLIILVGIGFYYRDRLWGPVVVEARTVIEKNNTTIVHEPTIIREEGDTTIQNVNTNVTVVNSQQSSQENTMANSTA